MRISFGLAGDIGCRGSSGTSVARVLGVPIVLCILVAGSVRAQSNPSFNVSFSLNFSAAEQCVELFDDQFVNTQQLTEA